MENKKEFLNYVLSKLEPHGPIKARAMFGGYGIYYDKTMFACIVENILYFRVDEENRYDYAPYRSKQFVYMGGQRPIALPYLELPKKILENPDLLPEWIEKSKDATLRYKAIKTSKIKKPRNNSR